MNAHLACGNDILIVMEALQIETKLGALAAQMIQVGVEAETK